MKPTQEQIDHEVAECRAMERKFPVSRPDWTSIIVALADEVERLRAERAEMLALLENINIDVAGRADGLDEWDERRRAVLAKLRAAR